MWGTQCRGLSCEICHPHGYLVPGTGSSQALPGDSSELSQLQGLLMRLLPRVGLKGFCEKDTSSTDRAFYPEPEAASLACTCTCTYCLLLWSW